MPFQSFSYKELIYFQVNKPGLLSLHRGLSTVLAYLAGARFRAVTLAVFWLVLLNLKRSKASVYKNMLRIQ